MTQTDQRLHAEHDAMMSRLASRRSTKHFAHAAVVGLAGLVLSAASGKLWWDFGDLYVEPTAAVALAGAAMLVYAIVRWVAGRRALTVELVDFARLQLLRRELRFDDPSALLP